MKADVTGRRLLIPETEEAEPAGCACCASAAPGRFGSPMEAVETYVGIHSVIESVPEIVSLYIMQHTDVTESRQRACCSSRHSPCCISPDFFFHPG